MSQSEQMNGGRFNFDDGGTYVGGWEDGKAHGHGVCTGPQAKGEYAGAWHYGFEVSGMYTWPSGNCYQGQWQNGKLHGLGVEHRGRGIFRGEWTQGYKGRYGVRQSTVNQSRYQGTWSAGFYDGYGTEIYVDGGNYQGQWLRGMRHGYGQRKSSTYSNAAKFRSKSQNHASMSSLRSNRMEEDTQEEGDNKDRVHGRGGFVLRANSQAPQRRRRSLSERSLAVKRTILTGLRIKKQHSTGDIHQRVTSMTGSLRSSGSTMSCTSDDSLHKGHLGGPEEEPVDENVTETYQGEWKNDCRSGFGVCDRSDGLRYSGEWANNAKNGYGQTTLRDGTKEEGKYKNNVLVVSARRRGAIFVRSSKIREKVEGSVEAASRAASIAQQKADIAASRTSTARERADQANFVGQQAKADAEIARGTASKYDPMYRPSEATRRQQLVDSRLDGSFATETSEPSYSKSNRASFEQTLSVDMAESSSYLTPTTAAPMGNHIGHSQHQQQANHVNFHPHPTYHGSASGFSGGDVNTANPLLVEDSPLPSQFDAVVELADDHPYEQQTAGTTNQMTSPAGSHHMTSSNHLAGGQNNLAMQHGQQSSSRFSLSDDHYDQYVMAGNPAGVPRIRRNRPSLMRQSDVNDTNAMLNRRSTLGSNRDRLPEVMTSPEILHPADNMGSLPNLAELETAGVRLRREDAARLASQRRQEVLRDQEDEALFRANPLRYIFHPAVRAWLSKWKVPLLLAAANLTLLCLFYNLLTYEKKRGGK